MLEQGVTLALGTDSRASNPSLSVFEEMRYAAQAHPGIAKATLVEMATLGGAKALGWEADAGTLEPGKRADFAVIELGRQDASDPHDVLFAPQARVAGTCIGGQFTTGSW
jgi:cytosine/adenosine deaminase-related metal-dependent hydrolase